MVWLLEPTHICQLQLLRILTFSTFYDILKKMHFFNCVLNWSFLHEYWIFSYYYMGYGVVVHDLVTLVDFFAYF